MIWRLIYNVVMVPLVWITARVYGMLNRKAARWLRGRKELWTHLDRRVRSLPSAGRRVWFHAASMGEFEQAKPIIAELKRRHPDVQVVVSFFSPSGYEHSQTYKLANVLTYIPFDSGHNARRFVEAVRPSAAVFIRYDVWPNHAWALRDMDVPTFLVSATLTLDGLKNLPVARQLQREVYDALNYILTVSPEDRAAFASLRLDRPLIDIVGDTRYDQVWLRSAESKKRQVFDARILRGRKVLVVGSSWRDDEEALLPACHRLFPLHPELLVVLVPHEPTVENIERIENELNGQASFVRFSELSRYNDERIVIVDSVGILMPLYQYAHVAFVGGSFRSGVHNVLEPAAYGVPIVIGSEHENSQEAVTLVREGGAFIGRNTEELYHHLRALFDDDAARTRAGGVACTLVRRNLGATQRILNYLERVL